MDFSVLFPVVLLVAVVLVLVLVIGVLKGDVRGVLLSVLSDKGGDKHPAGGGEPRYRSRAALLTQGESAFFPVVESVLPDLASHLGSPPIRAFAKVNLWDLLEPDCPNGKGSPYQSWKNRIDRKHTDVLLVEADSFRPVCVIELDDRSHRRASAQKSDAVKDDALKSAGIPIVRISAKPAYDRRDVARSIAKKIQVDRAGAA